MITIILFFASALIESELLEREWVVDDQSSMDYVDPTSSWSETSRDAWLKAYSGRRIQVSAGSVTFVEPDGRNVGPYTYSIRPGEGSSFELSIDESSQEAIFTIVSLSENKLCLRTEFAAAINSDRKEIMVECYVPSDA